MIVNSPHRYIRLLSSLNQKHFSALASYNNKPIIADTYRDQMDKKLLLSSRCDLLIKNSQMNNYSTITPEDNVPEKVEKDDPMRKPSLEQLIYVENFMKSVVPKFLKETHPYGLYTTDLIFENLFWDPPKITTGLMAYAIELLKLRWKINVKFSNAQINILKITNDEEDGTVKVRWRLRGIRGMKILTPWKLKVWNLKESMKRESEWHDGFSILYVRGDGRIYKHTIQRVIAHKDENAVDKKTDKIKNLLKKNVNVGTTMCVNDTKNV